MCNFDTQLKPCDTVHLTLPSFMEYCLFVVSLLCLPCWGLNNRAHFSVTLSRPKMIVVNCYEQQKKCPQKVINRAFFYKFVNSKLRMNKIKFKPEYVLLQSYIHWATRTLLSGPPKTTLLSHQTDAHKFLLDVTLRFLTLEGISTNT